MAFRTSPDVKLEVPQLNPFIFQKYYKFSSKIEWAHIVVDTLNVIVNGQCEDFLLFFAWEIN